MIASAMEDTSTASYHCGVSRGLLGFVFHAYVYKRAYAAGIKKGVDCSTSYYFVVILRRGRETAWIML